MNVSIEDCQKMTVLKRNWLYSRLIKQKRDESEAQKKAMTEGNTFRRSFNGC